MDRRRFPTQFYYTHCIGDKRCRMCRKATFALLQGFLRSSDFHCKFVENAVLLYTLGVDLSGL
jgi:hypothetical protein